MADSPAPSPKTKSNSLLRAFRSPGRNRDQKQQQAEEPQQPQPAQPRASGPPLITPVSGAGGIPEAGGGPEGGERTSTSSGGGGNNGGGGLTSAFSVKIGMARSGSAVGRVRKNVSTPALSKYLNAMDHEDTNAVTPGGILKDPKQATSHSHTVVPKIRYANEHSKSPFSFIRVVIFGKRDMGLFWFIKKVLPQLIFGMILNALVDLTGIKRTGWWSVRTDTQRLHAYVGAVLAFVLVFRSNGAYDRYYEARKTLGLITNQCREIILETCSMFTKDGDDQHIHTYRNEIRRKVHTMLAFIRQNTRESHVGFQPNSSEAKTPFHVGNNYVRDPTRPRLCDLLTPAEVEAYGKLMVSARAACVASEIKGITQLLAKHVEFNIMMYTKVSSCLQVILDGQETLFRIITTPLPFPYHWILNAMLIVFVYSVPFLYESYRGASYFGTAVLVLSYFGCQRIAEQCENPLEWDACDLDVEALTMWIHDETRDISKFTHSQACGFIPTEIRPPSEHPPTPATTDAHAPLPATGPAREA